MPFAWIAGRRGAGIQRKATTALALSPLRAAGFTISTPISSSSPKSPSTRHPNLLGQTPPQPPTLTVFRQKNADPRSR
jgi:hypothetical protein